MLGIDADAEDSAFVKGSFSLTHSQKVESKYQINASVQNSALTLSTDTEREEPRDTEAKSWFNWKWLQHLTTINATNLPFNSIDPGNWDEWGIYYCSSRYGRHTKYNPSYFGFVAVLLVGQTNFFDLIHLMHKHGGVVFLIVLCLTYVSFGYLMFLLETMLGQYSGNKTIAMIRLLSPAFSGLGVAMYLRTFYRAVHVVGRYSNCLYLFWDLLFCRGTESLHLKGIVLQEKDHRTFIPFNGLTHPYTDAEKSLEFSLDKWIIFISSLCLVVSFKKLKEFGSGMYVVFRLLFLFLFGYLLNAYLRTSPPVNSEQHNFNTSDSISYYPLHLAFAPNWLTLINGTAWLQAMVFVIGSLQLDTVTHTYLGSKIFYHYHSTRDGLYLILALIFWNLIGVLGALLWFGYVGINKDEMVSAFEELNGNYGMFVVFAMKHLQAEMTEEVESDILFYCAVFYFITGLAAILATVCYLYILTDCAYFESGHALSKLTVLIWYVFIFGIVLLPMMTSPNGVRHLIFLDYYAIDDMSGILIILYFTLAITCSQGLGRYIHDFYNMIHLRGYEIVTQLHLTAYIFTVVINAYPCFAIILKLLNPKKLKAGSTNWEHPATLAVGYIACLVPHVAVISGVLAHFFKHREPTDRIRPLFKPHRDLFKNKHHVCVCFKDYIGFDQKLLPAVATTSFIAATASQSMKRKTYELSHLE